MSTVEALVPTTFLQAASALRAANADGRRVRIVGGATKIGWGRSRAPFDVELHTTGLNRLLAHNAGDMTATLEAGVPLASAQAAFAQAGQMLSLDPPPAPGDGAPDAGATIGGIVATGDSGPLAHRYGGPRDLVVGATVALADGTIAKSGGTVIKNVAGYDIAKLMAGSFGTLGLILSVNVRLHPLPERTATVVASTADAHVLARAAHALASAPAELEALDVRWGGGRGALLARVAGPRSEPRAQRLAQAMTDAGLSELEQLIDDDRRRWDAQRGEQRSADRATVRVATGAAQLAAVIAAVDGCGGSLVGRAGLGHSWVQVQPAAIADLRSKLPAGATAIVQDLPRSAASGSHADDPWGPVQPALLELMQRLKLRFDPGGTCNPGTFVGGI
jgi:glycolate dehydrogenase FAD-binding subunit